MVICEDLAPSEAVTDDEPVCDTSKLKEPIDILSAYEKGSNTNKICI